jgi:hypothetical protein
MFSCDKDFTRADWPLLQNGAINLFWKPTVLADSINDLATLGYEISEIDCESKLPDFCEQISWALKWKEQFGYSPWSGNLDAFNDGLSYFPFGHSGQAALVLHNFHIQAAHDLGYANKILDLIECNSRDHLLQGKILLCLVQTGDNHYEPPVVGGRPPQWNRREWSHSDRGM